MIAIKEANYTCDGYFIDMCYVEYFMWYRTNVRIAIKSKIDIFTDIILAAQ